MPAEVKLSTHPRAAKAAAKVRPTLERDLWEKDMRIGEPVFLRAFKEERVLEVFVKRKAAEKYELFRSYHVAGTSGSLGPKLAEGDDQIPEGFYYTGLKLLYPNSMYYLSFNIGYPNAYDRFHQRTGSHIMIHGSNISIGCLAMTDEKIEEIYTMVDAALNNGQSLIRVHIFPFRMTEERMVRAAGNPNVPFWENLREGFSAFETCGIPPEVDVDQGRYLFKKIIPSEEGP